MPPTNASQITMEKTPSYFVTTDVPRRVYRMSRDIKLLMVVRDPVTRATSDYAQTASKRPEIKPFEMLAFVNQSTVDPSWTAVKIGVYYRYLEQWLRFFPLEQFHFVSGERLIKDPAGEMATVQQFLGLSHMITQDNFYFNETKGFPCAKRHKDDPNPRCLGKTKGRLHPKINSSLLKTLRDFYRPLNEKFYSLTRRDFGWP